jgi:hypothetical protein
MSVRVVRKYLPLVIAGFCLFAGVASFAQDNESYGTSREDKGATASETISATSNSISGGLTIDTNIGWNFTKHFGVDVGVPYMLLTRPGLFAGTSNSLGYVNYPYIGCTYFYGCYEAVGTSPRMWAGELSDVYAETHYTRTYHAYNFLSNLTGDLPTASYRKGMTTGRAQYDWLNHIDTNLHGFDPFVNFGLANGRMDQHFLPRPFETDLPFRTLGYMSDFEGGVQYKVWRRFTIGASMWDVLPFGPQKIYSNLVWQSDAPDANNILTVGGPGNGITGPGPGTSASTGIPGVYGYLAGDPNHGRYWNQAFETTGPAYIDRDNGYSATLTVSPSRYFDVLVAYNHSVRYALDTVQLTLQLNANSLFRKVTNY